MGSTRLRIAPLDLWFLGRIRIQIRREPLTELGRSRWRVSQSLKQFADATPDERIGIPRSCSTEYVTAIQKLGGTLGDESRLPWQHSPTAQTDFAQALGRAASS